LKGLKLKVRSKKDLIQYLLDKTEFERKVLLATFDIPSGKVSTYKRIAERIGRPKAYRAVGNALRRNPIMLVIPCHRVIREDGRIGGSGYRARLRRILLEVEGVKLF